MKETFENTQTLSEFCREMKRYEQTKIVFPEFLPYYYEEKCQYILKSFGKELRYKVSDLLQLKTVAYPAVNDLTLFMIVP